jgi:hypothetical protein
MLPSKSENRIPLFMLSLYINFGVNFWQTPHPNGNSELKLEFLWGELPSAGGASGRAAEAGFARRTGAEGGENPSRLLFTAFGTF